MIVITGANGQLGRFVLNGLLKHVPASQIVAAVRTPEKATDLAALGVQVRQADYDRPQTLATAFDGAIKVLLISSSAIGNRIPQHEAVVSAAQKAGVKALAYTSILNADTSPLMLAKEHLATEKMIIESGIPFVFLRNGWYVENYAGFIPAALAQGALIGCAGDARISCASRADYAEAAVAVLAKSDAINVTYELAGDVAYTLSDFADEVGRQSGKDIRYLNMTQADYVAALTKAGLPPDLAKMLGDSDAGAARGALYSSSRDLHNLIGRETTSLSAAIHEALKPR